MVATVSVVVYVIVADIVRVAESGINRRVRVGSGGSIGIIRCSIIGVGRISVRISVSVSVRIGDRIGIVVVNIVMIVIVVMKVFKAEELNSSCG